MPDETVLRTAASDIDYEVERFFQAGNLFKTMPEGPARRLVLEAQLLHFRNLVDFFYVVSTNSDDVQAAHYCDEWKSEPPIWLSEYRKRCNKLLSHLTYARADYAAQQKMVWRLDDKVAALREVWCRFLDALPPHRRSWFRYIPSRS